MPNAYVYEAGAFFRKGDAAAAEFFDKYRHVEVVGVVAGEVAAGEPGGEGFGDLAEPGGVFYVFVRDAMDGGSCGRDGDAGIDEVVFFYPFAAGHDLDGADLHDTVGSPGFTSGLVPVVSRSKKMRGRVRCMVVIFCCKFSE